MTRSSIALAALAVMVLFMSKQATAEIVTFKENSNVVATGINLPAYGGTQDTWIHGTGCQFCSGRDSHWGSDDDLHVGKLGNTGWSDAERRGLIRFDISALAGQYTAINSVTLRLYTHTDGGAGGVDVFRITPANGGWSEGSDSGGFNSSNQDHRRTTWSTMYRGGGPVWSGGAGLATAGLDYFATSLAPNQTNPGGAAWTPGTAIDFVFTSDGNGGSVQDLIDTWVGESAFQSFNSCGGGGCDFWFDPTLGSVGAGQPRNNAGILLRPSGGVNDLNTFHSATNSGSSQFAPELIIDFEALIIPEPSAFILTFLGAAAAACCWRRRSRH